MVQDKWEGLLMVEGNSTDYSNAGNGTKIVISCQFIYDMQQVMWLWTHFVSAVVYPMIAILIKSYV